MPSCAGSTFDRLRLTFRALLTASLLILGNVLFICILSIKTPISLVDETLANSLKTLSVMIFLTLLWSSFTILEQADLSVFQRARVPLAVIKGNGSEEKEEEEVIPKVEEEADDGMFFEKAWVEGGLSCLAVTAWTVFIPEAAHIFKVFDPSKAPELVMIHITYSLAHLAIYALHIQYLLSIISFTRTHGLKAIISGQFWNRRSGWWAERIQLDEDEQISSTESAVGCVELEDGEERIVHAMWEVCAVKSGKEMPRCFAI